MKRSNFLFIMSLFFVFSCSNPGEETAKLVTFEVDSPSTTKSGNVFTAPEGWTMLQKGPATILEVPEKGSFIVLVDVEAETDSSALAKGWEAYSSNDRELVVSNEQTDQDGWSRQRSYVYKTSPNEKRSVVAGVMFANDMWTVWIYDMEAAIGEKRGAQINLIFSSLLPKGYARESFAGKKANKLSAGRVKELTDYIENSMKLTGVPGVGLGIIENGKVVYADGFGVRSLGKPAKIDDETLFIIASNTKALTTLLLAKLVDEGKISWDTPVIDLLPSFRLGSEETTSKVLVEHLVCACTGLPRKDMEMIFEYEGITAEILMERLGETEPTSGFGEMFQYSNSLAAAAGYVAGHVMYPDLDIGAAYDKAMQVEVFDPLGMSSTTLDFARAQAGNHAGAHGQDIYGKTGLLDERANDIVIFARPAGGGWSNVNDMLKYINMELSDGLLPDGTRYIGSEALLERRLEKVPISEDAVYGMGLMVDETYGIQVVHHGGDVLGHHSDMMWLPEYGVGAVVLTNSDPGWLIRSGFQRKLLEVLFDGKPEADSSISSAAKRYFNNIQVSKAELTIPADPDYAELLDSEYQNDDLGFLKVINKASSTIFDFGEWKSEMASEVNPDSTVSFSSISPGYLGFGFILTPGKEKELVFRDAQHEYIFKGK